MIAQLAIFVLSAASIGLLSNKTPSRWGWVVGLASSPFWLYETYQAAQWGMFANALAFAGIYARGLVNHWRAPS